MGYYFDATDTRRVVSSNYNKIRSLLNLNNKQLADRADPIGGIQYSSFRRLSLAARDAAPEELNTLYELLAVPPTTFMFPWALRGDLFSLSSVSPRMTGKHTKVMTANPLFDYIGTPSLPYAIYGRRHWLPATLVSSALTSADVLLDLSLYDGDRSRRTAFQMIMEDRLNDYAASLFPAGLFDSVAQTLNERYPIQPDGHVRIGDASDYLRFIGDVLVGLIHRTAMLDFYRQMTEETGESIFMRCFPSDAFAHVLDPWNETTDDFQTVIDHMERTGLEISLRITRKPDVRAAGQLILTTNGEDGAYSAGNLFDLTQWLSPLLPLDALVRIAGQQDGSPSSGSTEIVLWEGGIREAMLGSGLDRIRPVLIDSRTGIPFPPSPENDPRNEGYIPPNPAI